MAVPVLGETTAPAVLQVVPHMEHGSVQRHVVELAREAAKAGWQIHIASTGGALERELIGYKARHIHLPVDATSMAVQLVNMFKLSRYARQEGISLIHAHEPASAWSAAFAAKRAGAAFLATAHQAIEAKGWLARKKAKIMVMGDRTIAASEHIAQRLVEDLQAERSRIRIIYRGVDLKSFDPEQIRGHRIAAVAERWGLESGRRVVMLPGMVIPANGHMLALAAMKAVEREDFDLVIIGPHAKNETYVKKLEREIERLGLKNRVRFGGFCDDMPAALALADIVILPATEGDGSGRTVLEAQAMGKPVIVSSVGSFSELVMPASTGWLIPPGDEGELAWSLDQALALEDEVKERLKERARQFIEADFNVAGMCEKIISVYNELRRSRMSA